MRRNVEELCLIGLDAEWKNEGKTNRILSYQYAATYRGVKWEGVVYVGSGRRRKLGELLIHILTAGKKAGAFKHFPKQVYVGAHFSLAEMTSLADFAQLKTQFDGVRRSFVTAQTPYPITLRDENRNAHPISLFMRDTMHLSAQATKLEQLGEVHGIPKVVLPKGMIERMDELLRDDKPLYEEYAITDARIVRAHLKKMAELYHQLTGETGIPVTLGALGVEFCRKTWSKQGVNEAAVLGYEFQRIPIQDQRGRIRTIRKKVALCNVHEHSTLVTECFHGARNEGYWFGPTETDDWTDADVAGAYPTALSMLGTPLWDQLRVTNDINDFTPGALGFAHVTFRFPEHVRFPTFPVRTGNNLVFVRQGETHVTATEIWEARRLGAEITIIHGVIVPMDNTAKPFRNVVLEAVRLRKEAKENGQLIAEKMFKELINSLYGKTAQGTLLHRVFDTREGHVKPIPPSQITNVFFAAFVTGFMRALLSEILNSLPAECLVVSATTDGFLSNATEADLEFATAGALSRMFGEERRILTGEYEVLAIKHQARAVMSARTRGQFTLTTAPGHDVILAKAGVKTPAGLTKPQQNEEMVKMFMERTPMQKYRRSNLRTLRKLYETDGDLVSEESEVRLNLEFDFKRRAVNPRMLPCRNVEHLAFDTVPWVTMQEFETCRQALKTFRGTRCLKTLADFQAFEEFRVGAGLQSQGLRRSVDGGMVETARRQFLRALSRSAWGLNRGLFTFTEISAFLTAGGYPTKPNDIKNAGRAKLKLVEHAVAPLPGVLAFVAYVTLRFPAFEAHRMLAPAAAKTTQNRKAA